ncbi:MAG: hypothetical protein PVJ57_02280 [Phycisphaerae bacterium]
MDEPEQTIDTVRITTPPRIFRAFPLLLVGLAALLATGCEPGLRWRFGSFDDAQAQARSEHRLTFVYFRNWYSVDCTNFEEHILKQPAVRAAADAMICVCFEFDLYRRLAERFELQTVPSYTVVDPNGTVLERGQGDMTAESVLASFERARQAFTPNSEPARTP